MTSHNGISPEMEYWTNRTPHSEPMPHGMSSRIQAFARDCVANGDMTPTAERMLNKILNQEA